MTLNGDFFYIVRNAFDGENATYGIRLNPEHRIYKAHFPGNPITPGVLIIKMVKELTALTLLRDLYLQKISQVKFMQVLIPVEGQEITIELAFKHPDMNTVSVSATFSCGETTFTKLTLILADREKGCVVIPTYNNSKTITEVLDSVKEVAKDIIVVNDGSTDGTEEILSEYEGISVVSYPENHGKGYALGLGFAKATELGFSYAVTMDSDGQHFSSDIISFIDAREKNPGALIVGNRNLTEEGMPRKNTFANKFSNFWYALQTLRCLPDTQTGFRLYPLDKMLGMKPHSDRYEAELELLVRCAWKGMKTVPVPVKVYYAPEGERVSHFRPGADFARISLLNTVLTLSAIVYGYPSMLIHKISGK